MVKTEWSWYCEGEPECGDHNGPHASREDAEADARRAAECGETDLSMVRVGRCRRLSVADFEPDMERMIQAAEEWAKDDDWHFYADELFDLDNNDFAHAEADLHCVLRLWAARWIRLADARIVEEGQPVRALDDPAEPGHGDGEGGGN